MIPETDKGKVLSLIADNQGFIFRILKSRFNYGIHFLTKLGLRFSRKALRPSMASSVIYAKRVASPAKTCCPTMPSSVKFIANLSIFIDVGDFAKISCAHSN